MSGVKIIKIKKEDDGIRLNRWFLREYPSLSMSRLQKLLRTKQIKVDGKRAETSTRLGVNQKLRIPPLDNEKAEVKPNALSQKDADFVKSLLIYKDEKIIVLNKPSGLAVQGGTNTVKHIDGMLEALKFEKEEKPRLVHRIDKETSGLLVLARDRKSAEILTKAFKDKNIKKTYLALVRGCPEPKEGVIEYKLEKVGEKMEVVDEGQKALTEIKVIDNTGKKFALVEAHPLTGRTHQIRAHLEAINTPILGDNKYFGVQRVRLKEIQDKLYLHAYKIDLSAIYNKKTVIKADLPMYFTEACRFLGLEIK